MNIELIMSQMYGLHYHGISSTVGMDKLQNLANLASGLDMKDFLFGNSPYMGNYIKPLLLRSSDNESTPSDDAGANKETPPADEDNDEVEEDDEEPSQSDFVAPEDFDQYGSHLSEPEGADDELDCASLSGGDTSDDQVDPDHRMSEAAQNDQSPAMDPRGEDSNPVVGESSQRPTQQSRTPVVPSCSNVRTPSFEPNQGVSVPASAVAADIIVLSDTEDDPERANTPTSAPASVGKTSSLLNEANVVALHMDSHTSLPGALASSSDPDSKLNRCVLNEMLWWEEKEMKRKQKKEAEEAHAREIQALKDAQSEYQKKIEKLEAILLHQTLSSQSTAVGLNAVTVAAPPSAPLAGPTPMAVCTVVTSQDSALHLPGYDAPRDPRPEDTLLSSPAPFVGSGVSNNPGWQDTASAASGEDIPDQCEAAVPINSDSNAELQVNDHYPRVEDSSRHSILFPQDGSVAPGREADRRGLSVYSTPPPSTGGDSHCLPPPEDEELVDYEDDEEEERDEQQQGVSTVVPVDDINDQLQSHEAPQVHSPDLSDPYEYV